MSSASNATGDSAAVQLLRRIIAANVALDEARQQLACVPSTVSQWEPYVLNLKQKVADAAETELMVRIEAETYLASGLAA